MSDGMVVQAQPTATPAARPTGHGDPCTMVIFGAAGDLSKRLLLPAIYYLVAEGLVAEELAIVGVGLDQLDDAGYRALVHEALASSEQIKSLDESVWKKLEPRLSFLSGDLGDDGLYRGLAERLEAIEGKQPGNRLFYLALPPALFAESVKKLQDSRLCPRIDSPEARPWARVVVEKPFGHSLETAQALSRTMTSCFAEHQIYRIDHYLGKEAVQNILVLRSTNVFLEPIWNRDFVAHVQITAAETVGVEKRAGYYEDAGVVRDMFQNHLMQLLALTAMELPGVLSGDAVRDQKVEVLRAVRSGALVQGQYGAGAGLPAYLQEPGVKPQSTTPTYAALRLELDSQRWRGVPFFLRSGKRLAKHLSEIAVEFKKPPRINLNGAEHTVEPNLLVMRVQPDDSISMRFEVKVPGAVHALTPELEVQAVQMNFNYADAFGSDVHPAYETLLLDCMIGDMTLFTRTDEVEAAWRITDPLLESLSQKPLASYSAGSWGPAEADALIAGDGFRWRAP